MSTADKSAASRSLPPDFETSISEPDKPSPEISRYENSISEGSILRSLSQETAAEGRTKSEPPSRVTLRCRDCPDSSLHESLHIVGIAGHGTSGLARLLRARGIDVSGSDQSSSSQQLESLRASGLTVFSGHAPHHVSPRTKAVIRSAAVPLENSEIVEASRRGLEIYRYAEYLGRLMDDRQGIAVAGTHGKSTTAAMLASIFLAGGRDPEVLIGAHHPDLNGNYRCGNDPELIVEACEFDHSFLELSPQSGIVTNIEHDHPDVYATPAATVDAFNRFLRRFRVGGRVVLNADDARTRELEIPPTLEVVHFSCEGRRADYHGRSVGPFELRVERYGRPWAELSLQLPGRHNHANALAAATLAAELGISPEAIQTGLLNFPGIGRRFERRGEHGGVEVIDDYAHHPTEIRSTIEAVRSAYAGRPLVFCFQVHQWSRLACFFDEFVAALARADRVILAPVYSVRECAGDFAADLLEQLSDRLTDRGLPVDRVDLRQLSNFAQRLPRGAVLVVAGAGDISEYTAELVAALDLKETP